MVAQAARTRHRAVDNNTRMWNSLLLLDMSNNNWARVQLRVVVGGHFFLDAEFHCVAIGEPPRRHALHGSTNGGRPRGASAARVPATSERVLSSGVMSRNKRKSNHGLEIRCGQGLRSGNHGVAARVLPADARAKKTIAIRIDITTLSRVRPRTHGEARSPLSLDGRNTAGSAPAGRHDQDRPLWCVDRSLLSLTSGAGLSHLRRLWVGWSLFARKPARYVTVSCRPDVSDSYRDRMIFIFSKSKVIT